MTTFFRLLKDTDKATALRSAVASQRAGDPDTERTFKLDPDKFRKVPNTPFAYWVDDSIRDLFVKLPPFESEGRTVKQGLATADDFRFVRAWWEVDADRRLDPVEGGAPDWREDLEGFQEWCRKRTHQGKYWVPFAKGGEYSPYYSDIHLVVNWKNEGEEMKAFSGSVIRNPDYYFRPGVTWPGSTVKGLNVRLLPPGCVFSHKGMVAFVQSRSDDGILEICAIMNSAMFEGLALIENGSRAWEVGVIQPLPYPRVSCQRAQSMIQACTAIIVKLQSIMMRDETTRLFADADVRIQDSVDLSSIAHDAIIDGSQEIERDVATLYGLLADGEPGKQLTSVIADRTGLTMDKDLDHASVVASDNSFASVSRLVGHAFLRFGRETAASPQTPTNGLLAPLPADSPAQPDESGSTVPAVIESNDLVRRIEETVSGFRNNLPKPWFVHLDDGQSDIAPDFFSNHLSMYTRSRRKAPIYWPLSTASGGYTIWLYYPRLDETTLFTAYQLAREKYDLLEKELVELQAIPQGDRTKQQQKRFDELVRDVAEVNEFAEEILRVTKLPYKPDHDDGVPICAAPLYKLFRHKQWSKYLQGIWDDLESGKYDWAHLAYAIWPDRVREKARKDKSIAIAHGLESET